MTIEMERIGPDDPLAEFAAFVAGLDTDERARRTATLAGLIVRAQLALATASTAGRCSQCGKRR